MLKGAEKGNAKQTMPASLANKERMARQESMSVCAKS